MSWDTSYNWVVPWNIRLREAPKYDYGDFPVVGDGWYAPLMLERDYFRESLSPRYWALPEPRRAPIIVRLPNTIDFCVDTSFWRHVKEPCKHNMPDGTIKPVNECPFCDDSGMSRRGEYYGDGWTVTGDLPRITVSPSINIVGSYHGWIQNGVISEDCEGRKFASVPGSTGV